MSSFILECKQCGAQVPYQEENHIAVCPYCGSLNTVAKSIRVQGGLINRANYLRRCNEFDKALAVYEDILKQDNTDYEAHWGTVICRYGIEYVEDSIIHEKIPTCHRTSSEPIYMDLSYKAALEYAPLEVREVYEKEAAQIDKIQKNIIALANNQEKYDIFICYKDTDAAENRTQDSVIAQELEFELSKRGYKVFFARKTLEGKLGSEYEPIIFAALHSSRAMVVLGTKPEHFTAVWVKNEWSRYRELIRKGAQKTLIPAYRDMSPYDLPQEFSNLQALDMGKLGFVQDLCDVIDRLTRTEKRSTSAPAAETLGTAAPSAEALLKRAFYFIEEGDYTNADTYLERVLDTNPEEARAYFGKWLAELQAKDAEQVKERILEKYAIELAHIIKSEERTSLANKKAGKPQPISIFTGDSAYRIIEAAKQAAERFKMLSNFGSFAKAVRFAPPELKTEYESCQLSIAERINQVINTLLGPYRDKGIVYKKHDGMQPSAFWSNVEKELGNIEALEQNQQAQLQAQQQAALKTQGQSSGSGCSTVFIIAIVIFLIYLLIKILM